MNRYIYNIVHGGIIESYYLLKKGFYMLLGIQCKYCSIELTAENARKRKHSLLGYRNECKKCRNSVERKRVNAPKKRCEGCGYLCWAKGKRFFCSEICRFKAHYGIDQETGCWEWVEKKDKNGYGKFIVGKSPVRAHRKSFEIFKGPIKPGMFICHTCDNPSCVNPEHLWQGTNQENQLDSAAKGRNAGIKNIHKMKFVI